MLRYIGGRLASLLFSIAAVSVITFFLMHSVPGGPFAFEKQPLPLQGDVPSPIVPPAGCRFHTRCPIAVERCRVEEPPLRELAPGQRVACHLAEQMAALPLQSALTPGSGLAAAPPGSG